MPEVNAANLKDALRWTEVIRKALGKEIFARSAVDDGLARVLAREGRRWGCILEIGTYRAASTVVLACFAETVITIDLTRQPQVDRVLAALPADLRNRICPVIVPNNDAKVLLARRLNFDMAFVDGAHTEGQTFLDFAITRDSGSVLLHDYPRSGRDHGGVGILVARAKDGAFTRMPPFAWWKAVPQ